MVCSNDLDVRKIETENGLRYSNGDARIDDIVERNDGKWIMSNLDILDTIDFSEVRFERL